jgi:hypothetical protein
VGLAAIHLSAMSNAGDDHEPLSIVHGVDDPIVPDPDAVVVSAGE